MDLSKLSDADLMALQAGDLSKVSDAGLQALSGAPMTKDERVAMTRSQMAQEYAPTVGQSFGQNALQGAGKAVADLGRGASMLIRSLGPQYNASADFFGLPNAQDVQTSRQLDAPLMATGGGKVGNFAGNAAMTAVAAPVFGATLPGAAAAGGAWGAVQPAVNTQERLVNVGLGGAGGALGQYVGNKAGQYVQNKMAANAKVAPQVAQKAQTAQVANKAGYVIPPEDLGGGPAVKALSGLSGKIKTAQVASERNQVVTNDLVRKELGLGASDPLNIDTLNTIRKTAGQDYAAVSGTGMVTPSPSYEKALESIVAPFKGAQKSFPNSKPNPVIQEIEALKSPQFDAAAAVQKISALREQADAAYRAGEKSAGGALKSAAGALENALDEHLVKIGAPPDLLSKFRDSRQLIAKTYTVQKALNSETGNISAQVLAGELKKGKPLSGGLETVARVGYAFPKATQALKEAPKTLSPLDFGAAGLGLMGSGGNPLAAAGLLARPMGRSLLLSGPMQSRAVARAGIQQAPSLLLRSMQEPVSIPAGLLAGGTLASYLQQQ